MNQPKKVSCVFMGVNHTPGACEIYRGNMPLYYLGQRPGWETQWGFFSEIVPMTLETADIVVFPRLFIPKGLPVVEVKKSFTKIKNLGIKIVYEVDDDYSNIHRVVVSGDAISPAKWADAITVTTPQLGEMMKKLTGRPYHVLPNCISPMDFKEGEPPDIGEKLKNKLVIALTGSPTHINDWRVMETVMPKILNKHKNVHFILMGYHPDYLEGLPQTSLVPPVTYSKYVQILRTCDIILAPVDPEDGFNNGKSPIKAIEGMAARRKLPNGKNAGAAVIATKNDIYSLAIMNGKNGILAEHNPESWYNALDDMISDKQTRQRIQLSGYKWVYKHHDISKQWKLWAGAYKKILGSPSHEINVIYS